MESRSNLEILNKWKLLAKDDFVVARLSYENRIYLQALFHCQQAIEKALKGLIIFLKNQEPPYTHDLIRLYKLIEDTNFYEPKNNVLFGGLNPYYIRARYPSYRDEISKSLTKVKVESYINFTQEVLKWLEVETK